MEMTTARTMMREMDLGPEYPPPLERHSPMPVDWLDLIVVAGVDFEGMYVRRMQCLRNAKNAGSWRHQRVSKNIDL